jgi:hypothetical protein
MGSAFSKALKTTLDDAHQSLPVTTILLTQTPEERAYHYSRLPILGWTSLLRLHPML